MDRTWCRRCGARLRLGHTGELCDPCTRAPARGGLLPAGFFADDERMRQALAGYDFATVFLSVRRATGYSQQRLGELIGLSQDRISRIERRTHRLRDIAIIARVASRLGVPPDLLGFTTTAAAAPDMAGGVPHPRHPFLPVTEEGPSRDVDASGEKAASTGEDLESRIVRSARGKHDEDVDRRRFFKAALGAGAEVMLLHDAPAAAAGPGDLVAAVSGPTAYYRRIESAVPSDQLAPAVDAHLHLATGIVSQQFRTSTGFGVLAEAAGLAAWLAADRGDNAAARHCYAEAVRHAERAHHPLLGSYMIASLGHFAVESGNPQKGVTLLDRAASQLDMSAPDTARAWLASLHAVAHATLGDRAATHTALRTVERLTSRQRGEPHWPWVFLFDRAKAARYQAVALGRLGDVRSATAAFDAAAPTLTEPKPRALAQLDHAHVLARAGRVGAGCSLATEALRVGSDYRSERITSRVHRFRATLPPRTAEAAALDKALAALYERETW